jgi:hypothetical protein
MKHAINFQCNAHKKSRKITYGFNGSWLQGNHLNQAGLASASAFEAASRDVISLR